ncbi:unnamed protein product, partial [Polarella glacialis]
SGEPEDETAAAAAIEEEAIAFSFEVPDGVQTGVVLKVMAPDNVQLHIPCPGNVQPGDRMTMQKTADGKWGIKHIVRPEAPPAAPVLESFAREVACRPDAQLEKDLNEPHVCTTVLTTSKGDIRLRIVPSWAPKGSQRFLQLVMDKYYTDLAIYRAVPDFLVQFGVVNDPARNSKYEAIEDDDLRGIPVTEGMVCFAASGADTRVATICIFLGEFPQLGKNSWETPIGKVCDESMALLRSLYTGYGDMPQCGGSGPDPIELEDKGNDYITEHFPQCDFALPACVGYLFFAVALLSFVF